MVFAQSQQLQEGGEYGHENRLNHEQPAVRRSIAPGNMEHYSYAIALFSWSLCSFEVARERCSYRQSNWQLSSY